MWVVLRSILLAALLALAHAVSLPSDFDGTVSILKTRIGPCKKKVQAQCDLCTATCNNIFKCMDTATLQGRAGSDPLAGAAFFSNGVMTGSTKDPKCGTTFQAAFTAPIKDAITIPDSRPGSLVVSSVTARFRIANELTTFVVQPTFTDNVVVGNLVAQCDGMTMFFSPGAICDCEADFRVDTGKVMGVDAAQETYDPTAPNEPVTLGQIYGLRVKQNLATEDFRACNETFMGAYKQTNLDGSISDMQCFRNFTVAEAKVSRYNQTVCGTQLYFFNRGQDGDQGQTTCRDGLGVVTAATDVSGASISGKPAGVFYHRDPTLVDATSADGTLDDAQWFFSLTPSKLALNASAQFDLELTMLTGNNDNRTQLTCIAEYKVEPFLDDQGIVVANGPILGVDYEALKQPDSASTVALATALLLPILLLLW